MECPYCLEPVAAGSGEIPSCLHATHAVCAYKAALMARSPEPLACPVCRRATGPGPRDLTGLGSRARSEYVRSADCTEPDLETHITALRRRSDRFQRRHRYQLLVRTLGGVQRTWAEASHEMRPEGSNESIEAYEPRPEARREIDAIVAYLNRSNPHGAALFSQSV